MKVLIFDCGGVLVYPRLGDWNLPFGITNLLGERARDVHTAKYLMAHRKAAEWLDESRLVPDLEEERRLRREYIRTLNLHMDWHMTQEEIVSLSDDFTDNINRYGLFDDVKPWLTRWRERYSLGILSDAMPSILKFIRQFGLYELFDGLVISTQVGAIKPDPRMYEAILSKLDARAEDCLFVDDRPRNLEGATAVGMGAVQMARSEFLPTELWDGPIVHSFEELDELLRR